MGNLSFISLLVMSCAVCFASDTFSRLNETLKNDAAIQFYANCFMDKGPCSGDGRVIKWLLPDMVATSCNKCSVKQKRVACRIITILQQKKHANTWSALLKKFDPKAIHIKNLDSFMKNCEVRFKIVIPKEDTVENATVATVATVATAATTEVNKEINEDNEKVEVNKEINEDNEKVEVNKEINEDNEKVVEVKKDLVSS